MGDPFDKVEVSRRKFVKHLAGGAFVVPTLLSFPPTGSGQSNSSSNSSTATAPPSPTPTPTPGSTPAFSPSPSLSTSPTPTPTPTPSPTPAPSPSASPTFTPFADFVARGDVELHPGVNDDTFEVSGLFLLGAHSDGIDPVHETVTITLGTGQWTIPAGLFTRERHGKLTRYTFQGMVGTTRLKVVIDQRKDGRYRIKIDGSRADLTGTTNPAMFGLTIGNDGGSTVVMFDREEEDDEDDD